MIDLEDAQAIVLRACPPQEAVALDHREALGYVLAESVIATEDVPPFDNSAMDGYAVRGVGSTEFAVVGESRAGAPYDGKIGEGEAVVISTGAAVPAGAEAVVRHQVPRVVTVSALGRGTGLYAGHVSASLAMDDLFRSTGAHVRALANTTFIDNLARQARSIADGVLTGTLPADLPLPMVATRDIAAAATALLLDLAWTGQDSVDLLGPDHVGQPGQHRLLLGEQVGAVQRAADVPVRGVQQPHAPDGRCSHRQQHLLVGDAPQRGGWTGPVSL